MIPRKTMVILAAGLNVSWLIAAGWGTPGSAAEPVSPEVRQENAAPPAPLPGPDMKLSPVKDFAPEATPPAQETSEATEGTPSPETPPPSPAGDSTSPEDEPAVEPAPQVSGEAASAIPPPDGVIPAVVSPISTAPDDLAAGTATPFTLPVSGSTEGGENLEPGEPTGGTTPPADDRSAPWVAAPGGYSMPTIGGFGSGLPAAPSGFTSVNPGFPMGGFSPGEGIFDGFSIAATFSGTYTSNATSSPGEPFAPIQDDFIFGLGGSISYLSKATDWTFGGSYTGNYNQYLELSDYSGYDQSLSLVGNYDGAKLSASINAGIRYDQGNNRYYSSQFVQQTSYNLGLNLRYRLSTKTSLQGNIGQNFSTTSESSYNDTESFNLGLAALWKYSKLTEFGPGVRYTFLSGGNRDNRTSIGPELLVNYQLAAKVRLNSRVGVEFSEYDSGGTADPSLTGSLGLTYNASKLWSMNLALYRGARADASSADVFSEISSVRLGYVRKIRRATLNLGFGYEINSYQTSGTTATSSYPDRNYFNLDGSIGMPVFSNTSFASVFLRYSDQSGSVTETWDAVQSGFSISRKF